MESVDDRILELAGLAGIPAVNPVFRRQERVISDVLPKARLPKMKPAPIEPPADKPPAVSEKKIIPPAIAEPKPKIQFYKGGRPTHRRFFSFKKVFVLIIVVGLGLGAFFVLNNILPKATIALTLKKMPVDFSYTVNVSLVAKTISLQNDQISIPGEILKSDGNYTLSAKANGTSQVERKATGTLVIYNAYSSQPQTLVANTRFSSPDGKIFRLSSMVKVPGAEIANGKIIPSQITVAVVADGPGEEYNIEPAKNWRLPGFQGTPRYQGFYADSLNAMAGGFTGVVPVPNDDDINKGKAALEDTLQKSLGSQMTILLADNLKLFNEAKQFQMTQETVRPADANGMFSVFGAAELRYLVFDEKQLKDFIETQAKTGLNADVTVKDHSLNYGAPAADLTKGTLSFPVQGSFIFEPAVDVASLKQQITGQTGEELRKTVFLLPGLERADISLWPFWVTKVPQNQSKIVITVD